MNGASREYYIFFLCPLPWLPTPPSSSSAGGRTRTRRCCTGPGARTQRPGHRRRPRPSPRGTGRTERWSSSRPRPATCCGTGCGPPCPRRRPDRGQRKLSKLGADKCRPTFATRTRAAATGSICAKERTSSILTTIVKSTRQR